MVQSVYLDRKWMTRRMSGLQKINEWPNRWVFDKFVTDEKGRLCARFYDSAGFIPVDVKCPYGKVGDILYVRETWCWDWLDYPERTKKYYFYKATTPDYVFASGEHWLPSIHMPKEAARLFLKITDIRVERANDISEEDAIAEGVEWRIMGEEYGRLAGQRLYKDYINPGNAQFGPIFAKDSFIYLWQSINGEDSWEANPWVWVITFERTEKP